MGGTRGGATWVLWQRLVVKKSFEGENLIRYGRRLNHRRENPLGRRQTMSGRLQQTIQNLPSQI